MDKSGALAIEVHLAHVFLLVSFNNVIIIEVNLEGKINASGKCAYGSRCVIMHNPVQLLSQTGENVSHTSGVAMRKVSSIVC